MVAGFVSLSRTLVAFGLVDAIGRRFSLSGRHVEVQVRQNDFERDKVKSPGSFAIVTGSEGALLYAWLGSHHLVFYPEEVRERLAKM